MLVTDENGVWDVYGNVRLLVEPSQAWINANQPHVEVPLEPPQPGIDEYLLDIDFRLSMIELGL